MSMNSELVKKARDLMARASVIADRKGTHYNSGRVGQVDRDQFLAEIAERVRWEGAGHIRTVTKEQAAGDMADFIESLCGEGQ